MKYEAIQKKKTEKENEEMRKPMKWKWMKMKRENEEWYSNEKKKKINNEMKCEIMSWRNEEKVEEMTL